MLHIDQSFKCEYSCSNFNFIERNNSNFFTLIPFVCHPRVICIPWEWLNVKWEFECHTNGLRETLFWLSRSNTFYLVRTAFWPTIREPFLSVWYHIAQRATNSLPKGLLKVFQGGPKSLYIYLIFLCESYI